MVFRMEDLDHPKVKAGAADQAMADLRWLGLDWDEGPDLGGPYSPYIQSQRMDHYRAALKKLREQDLVYPCICSRRDVLAAQSAPHEGDDSVHYPGLCRDIYETYDQARSDMTEDRIPVWRFRAPDQEIAFQDVFHGEQKQNVHRAVGDFVLARHRDGAGYTVAVVADDAAMNITEVLRGDDLLSATHRQILLYRALGLKEPTFVHVPLVVGSDGRRLAKRHGDTRISHFKDMGIEPARIVGMLAHWCGWASPGELLMPKDLISRYDLASLSPEELVWDGSIPAAERKLFG